MDQSVSKGGGLLRHILKGGIVVLSALTALTGAFWLGTTVPQTRREEASQKAADSVPDAHAARPAKYACSMMCLPPVDRPGKCPICGMEMIAVEEHGGSGTAVTGEAGEITLSEAAQRLARIQLATVERRWVSHETRMTGKVDFDETRQRTITARVPGRLERLFVDYTGVPVKQGEHLVDLYSPNLLGAQQELIQSYRAYQELPSSASEDLRRAKAKTLTATRQKLSLWGLTPEQITEIEQRGTSTDHLTIYAPIGGIVTEKRVVQGAYVETGTEIYTIVDLTHVWVKLDAYEMDLAALRYGQEVEFTTEAFPGESFKGTIAFIDPVINARTRTVKVRVNVPNLDGRLKPEMFVRAVVRAQFTADGQVLLPQLAGNWICPMHPEVISETSTSCRQCGMPLLAAQSLGYASENQADAKPPLVIPKSAVLMTGRRALVYVAIGDRPGRFEGREVVLGPRVADYYLIRNGLEEGEQVVAHGNLNVDSAVQILGRRSMMHPDSFQEPSESEATASEPPVPERYTGALPESVTKIVSGLFDRYFEMQDALSHDQFAASRTAAEGLAALLRMDSRGEFPEAIRNDWVKWRESLQKSVGEVVSAKDIEVARASFEGVSLAMTSLGKRLGPVGRKKIWVYHCPMAFNDRGASWLQAKGGVENPYFGASMFTCGVFKEAIESVESVLNSRKYSP